MNLPKQSIQNFLRVVSLILCFSLTAGAEVPHVINYQGLLMNNLGNPVANGNYSVVFKIYDDPTGGNVLWSETQTVTTNNGQFSVILGSTGTLNEIPDSAFSNTGGGLWHWLGIKVGADPEMTPRQKLVSVGYSFRSERVNTVAGAGGGSLTSPLSFGNFSSPMLYIYESGTSNPTRSVIAHSPAFTDWGLAYDDANDRMEFLRGGSPVLSVGLQQRFVGVNRASRVSSAEYFGIDAPVSTGDYGGMYISTGGVDGLPFYGYSTLNHSAWTYLDGPSGEWRLNYNGDVIRVKPSGAVGIPFADAFNQSQLYVHNGGTYDYAIQGVATGVSKTAVKGFATGVGVSGQGSIGVAGTGEPGIRGSALSTLAGEFLGNVTISGTLAKGGGGFKIDHPLDPANKYLYHSFVESPDMKNIYDGVVTTDERGNATVTLPDWFGALNKDFRYQLTVIGEFAQAIISEKIKGNQFSIKTDKPNIEVSWQVTGIRQDAFANAHRIPVEEEKPAKEMGKYLHPKEHGVSKTLGMSYEMDQEMEAERKLQEEQLNKIKP